MIKIATTEQMRVIERASDAAGVSYAQLMQNAGEAVAQTVRQLLGADALGKRVTVLVGKGNNGGDGLVAARILKQETEAIVGCYLLARRSEVDSVYSAARGAGILLVSIEDDEQWRLLREMVSSADIVIDAVLGTGARLPLTGAVKEALAVAGGILRRQAAPGLYGRLTRPAALPSVNIPGTRVVAVDCPSGLDCDTGQIDEAIIPADVTVTFAAAKHGQLRFPGAGVLGDLVVADIGVPPDIPELAGLVPVLVSSSDAAAMLPGRPRWAHKGTFGRVTVAGGSITYTGAALLAGRAAYRVGAGLVRMAVPSAIHHILATQFPEAIWLPLPDRAGVISDAAVEPLLGGIVDSTALLVGPGLGHEEPTAKFMRHLLKAYQSKPMWLSDVYRSNDQADEILLPHLPSRLVIDADGLNILSEFKEWWKLLPPRAVLTPHAGEMRRLSGLDAEQVMADRLNVTRDKARAWNCVLVLKGAFTVIADPDGRVAVTPFATDALAKAGSGDVLAGCILGFLSQGCEPFEAAVAGTYVHGLAGTLAGNKRTTRSVIAGDLEEFIGLALAHLEEHII